MSLDEMMPWGEMSESVYLLYADIKNDNSGRHAAASLAMHTEWSYLPRTAAHCPFFLLLPS